MGVVGKETTRNDSQRAPVGTRERRRRPGLLGIVVIDGVGPRAVPKPRMTAFIWGGKVAPTPTLPYGRWKSVA